MSFAFWRRCDFQVHTPRDPNWTGARPIGVRQNLAGVAATANDVDQQREEWADRLIDACAQRSLGAIAVTDHHEMIMVPYVQRAAERRRFRDGDFDLWVFPGMELTARNGVQCLIIFDAALPEEWRREAQSRLGIVTADLDEKAQQAPKVTQLVYDYADIAEALDHIGQLKGRYIVLPNVSQGGQHTVLTNGAHADFKRMPYVGGYLDRGQNIDNIGATNKRRLSGKDAAWGDRFIYPMPTSDSRSADFAALGTNDCWIKLAEPTAEAIRQAFLGYQSRISIAPPAVANLSIKSVRIAGSTILEDETLLLSPELNSFIGGRGSGKSTYLEYIAFGLGRSCFDFPKGDYSGSDRMVALIKDTLVSAGATIELRVLQDGAEFLISRSGGNAYQPRVTYPDQTIQDLSAKELRSLFPAVVYSQGELSEIGKQAGKRAQLSDLLQFVDLEFKREDDRLAADIESAKLKVRTAVQSLSGAWGTQYDLHKLQTTKVALEQRILALQKTLPALSPDDQKIVANFEALAALDAKRVQADSQITGIMEKLTDLWRTARQPVDLTSAVPEAAPLEGAYKAFNDVFSEGVEALGKELARARDMFNAESRKVATALEAAKAARDKALEKLVEHRNATAQISTLQNELQRILSQIGQLQVSAVSPDEKFAELQSSLEALKTTVATRSGRTSQWANQIEKLSGGRIKAQLNVEGDLSEIRDALDAITAKTGSQEATRLRVMSEQIEKSDAWAFLDELRADAIAALRWKQIGSSLAGDRPSCAAIAQILGGNDRAQATLMDLVDLTRVEAVATAIPRSDITLYYCDEQRQISFEKASEGQRAAALLFMLLEQPGGPLIVDQPEGDLDNKVISILTDSLHNAKPHRQIIFASHNANIVVNGSSELVAAMDLADDGKRANRCCGAIDRADVCAKITETMEGGEKAFRDRKNKYGY
jgi:type III restriction enzyme